MLDDRHDSFPAAELDAILGDPVLRGRWPAGFTVDEVLADLMQLGQIAIDVCDDPDVGDMPPFACRLELSDATAAFGQGHTLTAAALRCLIEAERDLASEVARGLSALADLLGDTP